MNTKPIVSVIVLMYNAENYIVQTLNSIINQKTRYPFEIIICDDSSTDNSVALVQEITNFHDKVKLYINEENIGIIANYKKAIDLSEGKYLAYCGHDDFWHNTGKLEKQVSFLEENPDYGFVHTDYNVYHDDIDRTTTDVHKSSNRIIKQGCISDDLIKSYYIGSCTVCFRKEIFYQYVPIQDYIRYRFPVEDWATYITMSIYTHVGYIDDSTATYRKGHRSESNPSEFKILEEYLDKHEIMFTYLKNKYPDKFSRFGPDDYSIYKNNNLLKAAYRFFDYEKSHKYAALLKDYNQKNIKTFFAKNKFTFYSYILFYRVYQKIIKVKYSKGVHSLAKKISLW